MDVLLILLTLLLIAAVAWAFAWGAHEHGSPVLASDLSTGAVVAVMCTPRVRHRRPSDGYHC